MHVLQNLRDSNHSPLDSTGSATESIASTPSNEESNHTASPINAETETDVRELDETAEAQKDDTAKSIDASSANEDEDDASKLHTRWTNQIKLPDTELDFFPFRLQHQLIPTNTIW